jgi:hypothetical protein
LFQKKNDAAMPTPQINTPTPAILPGQAEPESLFERIPGVPHTAEQLRERATKAEADIAAGRYITSAELKKRMATW